MEELVLSKYLELCLAFTEHPTAESEQAIKNYLNKIVIREYLPMKDKMMVAMSVLSRIPDDYDAISATGFIMMGEIVEGLISYAVNVKNDIGIYSLSYGAVDLMYEHGLIDTIRSKVIKDYNEFDKIFQQAINFSNIFNLIKTAALVNPEEYQKWDEMMANWKEEMTPEVLEGIKSIVAASESGDMTELQKVLAETALDDAKKSFAQNKASIDELESKKESK